MDTQQMECIRAHGLKLLAIFPAVEIDPLKLCRKLHRIEREAHRYAERLCTEDVSEAEQDAKEESIMRRVLALLGDPEKKRSATRAVFLNRDPRGYALKIDSEIARDLDIPKDWGGYGLLAPELEG